MGFSAQVKWPPAILGFSKNATQVLVKMLLTPRKLLLSVKWFKMSVIHAPNLWTSVMQQIFQYQEPSSIKWLHGIHYSYRSYSIGVSLMRRDPIKQICTAATIIFNRTEIFPIFQRISELMNSFFRFGSQNKILWQQNDNALQFRCIFFT